MCLGKKVWNTDPCCIVDESQEHDATSRGKNTGTKGHVVYYTIYMKCPEQANP